MRDVRAREGYALLTTLFITSLAAVFAAACVAAVWSSLGVVRADHSRAEVGEVARAALGRAALELRRTPGRLTWRLAGADTSRDASWTVTCRPTAPVTGAAWPGAEIDVQVSRPAGANRLRAIVQLRAEPVAQGVVIGRDAELSAPLSIAGGGLYVGGSLGGREWLSFLTAPSGVIADGVHGDVWPLAAAHALGGIWAEGEEVHAGASPDPRYAVDTDVHTGAGPVETMTQAPDPCTVTELADMALTITAGPGDPVDLDRLPAAAQDPAAPSGSACVVFVPEAGEAVRVRGSRPAGACPLVLVVEGDAILGETGSETSLEGALVVCGDLDIAGPSSVMGHVYARSLGVEAPLDVVTPADWRRRTLPGLTRPVITAVGR
jgi:hypothetical protein